VHEQPYAGGGEHPGLLGGGQPGNQRHPRGADLQAAEVEPGSTRSRFRSVGPTRSPRVSPSPASTCAIWFASTSSNVIDSSPPAPPSGWRAGPRPAYRVHCQHGDLQGLARLGGQADLIGLSTVLLHRGLGRGLIILQVRMRPLPVTLTVSDMVAALGATTRTVICSRADPPSHGNSLQGSGATAAPR
jgi:hypothetical protein